MKSKVAVGCFLMTCWFLRANAMLVGGGADTGGAGDYDKTHVYSWMPRGNPTYCVEVSQDFGLSRPQVAAIVEQAIAKWEEYLSKRVELYMAPFYRRFEKQATCQDVNIRFALGQFPEKSSAALFCEGGASHV